MSRDRNRIEFFVTLLAEYWARYPDLRFGQLMCNLQSFAKSDLFYIEDSEFLDLLKRFCEENK